MYNVLFWIAVQLVLLWSLDRASKPYRNKKAFKIAFLPSTLAEALFKLVACCFSATRVKEVEFFEDGRPFVTAGGPRIPYFGLPLFLILWLGVSYGCFHAAFVETESGVAYSLALPHVDPVAISEGYVRVDARSFLAGIKSLPAAIDWGSWGTWFFLYVVIGSFPFFSISAKQLRCGLLVLTVLGFLAAVCGYFGIGPGFLSRGWWLKNWILPDYFRVYSFFLTLLGVTSGAHYALRTMFRATGKAIVEQAKKSDDGRKRQKKQQSQKQRKEPAHA